MRKMIPVWVSHYLGLIDDGLIRIPEIDHVVSHYSSHSLREEVVKLLTAAGAMIDERKWFSNLVDARAIPARLRSSSCWRSSTAPARSRRANKFSATSPRADGR